jgi:hypothetical protein
MLWKIAVSLFVGAVAYFLIPLIAGILDNAQFGLAVTIGTWLADNRNLAAFLVAVGYFFFGRWFPRV